MNAFKYTCPRCAVKTCSLICCRKHKEETECNGQRDKTKFLKKEAFTDLDLLSDYRFLEESSNVIDAAHRQATILDRNPMPYSTAYNGFYDNLRKFVSAEFNITLNLMPMQATRHLANKTRFNRASKVVSWSLELIFHLSNESASNLIKLNTKKNLFSSKDTMRDTLVKFYEKYKSDLFEPPSYKSKTDMQLDSSLTSTIALYTEYNSVFESANFKELNILMQIVNIEKKRRFFIKVDLNETLESVLKNKTLLEYPTFYIVKSCDLGVYTIETDQENEATNEVKNSSTKKNLLKKAKPVNETSKENIDLEEGECDSEFSDEFEQSDENETTENNTNDTKRLIDDTEINVNKKHKLCIGHEPGELSEDGELDESD